MTEHEVFKRRMHDLKQSIKRAARKSVASDGKAVHNVNVAHRVNAAVAKNV